MTACSEVRHECKLQDKEHQCTGSEQGRACLCRQSTHSMVLTPVGDGAGAAATESTEVSSVVPASCAPAGRCHQVRATQAGAHPEQLPHSQSCTHDDPGCLAAQEQLNLLPPAKQVFALQDNCRLTHSRLYILLTESNSCQLAELSWLHAAMLLPARLLTGQSRLAALLGLLGANHV